MTGYPLLTELLDRHARVSGDRIALSDAHRSWSFGSLGALVGHLVEELKDLDTAPGEPVAIAGPRDARLLALLYGVLGCGNPIVAVSPDWSEADLARRLRAVGVRVLLRTEGGEGPSPAAGTTVRTVDVDGAMSGPAGEPGSWGWAPAADDVVYYSFTSGSSGEPKAVAVAQRNAAHYAARLAGRLGFGGHDAPSFAHMTTLAADLGHTGWLLALATGGRVHVVSDEVARDPYAFWAELAEHRVTNLKTTPSHLAALLPGRPADAAPLDTTVIGGELLSREFAAGLLERGVTRRVVNHYGPTETTVGAACFVARHAGDLPGDETSVPIGTPIGDGTLRLDNADGPVGELVIGGAGVSLGYAGVPWTPDGRFRMSGGEPEYHTGDRCRRRPDGAYVFLGRADRQAKVNGYRVDLAEIEQVLARCPGVAHAAVYGRTVQGQLRLVAAIAGADGEPAADLVAAAPQHLARHLPRYAVPAPIVALAEFPVTANGKRDDHRILQLIEQSFERGGGRAADGLEDDLARFWAAGLGVREVDPDADVMSLGGDSILAMRTVVFLRERGHDVLVTDVYDHPTAARLAAVAAQRAAVTRKAPAEDARNTGGDGTLGPAQRHHFDRVPGGTPHWNQVMLLTCRPALDLAALGSAVAAVLRRHDALRRGVSPAGALTTRYPDRGGFTVTWSPVADGPAGAESIARTSSEINLSLDPEAGRLLRCHVFRGGPGVPDRLLLVGHHLVVDTVSWRILIDDLLTSYEAVVDGADGGLAPAPSYYEWAASAREEGPARPAAEAPGRYGTTYAWSATRAATRGLVERYGAGRRAEALIVASMARALQQVTGGTGTSVTVETHGRDQGDHAGGYLDTVGWFTAVKPVLVGPLGDDVDRNVAEVERQLLRAPVHPMDLADHGSPLAVNYLGQFRTHRGRHADWAFAPEYCGPARAELHDPAYPMVLTARIVGDRLVADLVCAEGQEVGAEAFGLFVTQLQRLTGAQTPAPRIVRPPRSTSGLPAYTGTVAAQVPARTVVREPARVLLTGATGFLGSRLLDDLVRHGAQAVCLVRPSAMGRADARLASSPQVRVVEGDLTDAATLRELAAGGAFDGITSVVNAAADVRLVAPRDELARVNVGGVRNLIELLRTTGTRAPLHHVSTLAVAGFHDGEPRRFSEAGFDLGQRFLSSYEASKFEAEKLVREASDHGVRCFIHRTNHIAADSRTGVFQSNVGDNRVYQTLKGYVVAGCAPSSPRSALSFSYVDTVAAGIRAIAMGADVPPDVYHVETPHSVPHDQVIRWMRSFGYPLRLVTPEEFLRALDRVGGADARSADMSRAWQHRPDRGVTFDNTRTVALLGRLGVAFPAPTQSWLHSTLQWAVGSGFLPAPPTTDPGGVTTFPVRPQARDTVAALATARRIG